MGRVYAIEGDVGRRLRGAIEMVQVRRQLVEPQPMGGGLESAGSAAGTGGLPGSVPTTGMHTSGAGNPASGKDSWGPTPSSWPLEFC